MGVFEEFPFMKNCGTTLERGRNWTWGRQRVLLLHSLHAVFLRIQELDISLSVRVRVCVCVCREIPFSRCAIYE